MRVLGRGHWTLLSDIEYRVPNILAFGTLFNVNCVEYRRVALLFSRFNVLALLEGQR